MIRKTKYTFYKDVTILLYSTYEKVAQRSKPSNLNYESSFCWLQKGSFKIPKYGSYYLVLEWYSLNFHEVSTLWFIISRTLSHLDFKKGNLFIETLSSRRQLMQQQRYELVHYPATTTNFSLIFLDVFLE